VKKIADEKSDESSQTEESNVEDQRENEDKDKVEKVFQGVNPRANASFFDKLLFRYTVPLLDHAKTNKVLVEQMGTLDDEWKINKDLPSLEANLNEMRAQYPDSESVVMWAVLKTYRKEYAFFLGLRLVMMLFEMLDPLLVMRFTTFI